MIKGLLSVLFSLFLILHIYSLPPTPTPRYSLNDYYGGSVPPARHRFYPQARKPFSGYRSQSQLHYGVRGGSHGFYWYYRIK